MTAPRWTPPVQVDPARGSPTSVSCRSDNVCVAVDAHGDAFIWNGSAWSKPRLVVSLTDFTSVSCASPTFCVAIGIRDRYQAAAPIAVTYDGTGWSTPVVLTDVFPRFVSCSSPTFCLSVASGGRLLRFDGTSWFVPTRPVEPAHGVRGISCASPDFCAVVAHYGDVSVFDGSGWSPNQELSTDLQSVSCPAADFCTAVGGTDFTTYDVSGSPDQGRRRPRSRGCA